MVDSAIPALTNSTAQGRVLHPISWPLPPTDWAAHLGPATLPKGRPTIHVWAASLSVSPEALDTFISWLSADELSRAARFHFPVHRDRFIAGRGLIRRLLASYLNRQPHTLTFNYGPKGKPALSGSAGTVPLSFNAAHSEDLLLIAVSREGLLGVDVEEIRPLPEFNDLVERFFCRSEHSQFGQLPSGEKPAAFFNLWTRKEAWLKATGEGIAHLLSQVEVSFLPAEPARLIQLPHLYSQGTSWFLYELTPKTGFAAALAVGGQEPSIHCWHYQSR